MSDKLKQYMDQLGQSQDRIDEEKAHQKNIKAAAKADGYEIKVINRILREKRMDAAKLKEFDDLTDTYKVQLGFDL